MYELCIVAESERLVPQLLALETFRWYLSLLLKEEKLSMLSQSL